MLLTKTGYGHWRVFILSHSPYKQKVIKSCTTTNSMAVDDFMSGDTEYEVSSNQVRYGRVVGRGATQTQVR